MCAYPKTYAAAAAPCVCFLVCLSFMCACAHVCAWAWPCLLQGFWAWEFAHPRSFGNAAGTHMELPNVLQLNSMSMVLQHILGHHPAPPGPTWAPSWTSRSSHPGRSINGMGGPSSNSVQPHGPGRGTRLASRIPTGGTELNCLVISTSSEMWHQQFKTGFGYCLRSSSPL